KADQKPDPGRSPPARVARARQVIRLTSSRKKRTEPSPIEALTPPEWLLRAAAQVLQNGSGVRVHLILWPAGTLGEQPVLVALMPGSWSFVDEFGVVWAVKVFAPGPGKIQTPRWSKLSPVLVSSTLSQLSTSLMNR